MRFKTLGIAAVAVATLIGAVATAPDADARRWGHRGGGWIGPAVVGGLALGAIATAPYAYGAYNCPRQIVGYNQWGRPIVRRVCY